jgi:hypothetical protein
MLKHPLTTLSVFLASTLAAAYASAAPLILDNFSETSTTWPVSLPTGTLSITKVDALSTSPFVYRATTLGTTKATNTGFIQPLVAIYQPDDSDHNVLELASPVNFPAYVRLDYATGANPADFSSYAGITVHFDSYDYPDQKPLLAKLTVQDVFGAPLKNGTSVPFNATSGDLFIPFSSVPTYNPATTYAVSLTFTPPAGADFRISAISTEIPEPTGAFALVPAAGLLVRRRRS